MEKVKTLCPSWKGNDVRKICRDWNTQFTDERAKIEDVDKSKRLIHFRVKEPVAITEFEAACNLMDAAAGVLYMMVVIKIPGGGIHGLHAVAAWMTYPTAQGRAMAARNSWGGAEPIKHVTRTNFIRAVLIEPELVERATRAPIAPLYQSHDAVIAAKRDEVILAMMEKAGEGGGAALETVVEAGVIPPLVQLLVRGTDEKKEKAARALEKLAANAANRAQIVQAGAMPPLTALLDSADDALKGSALRVVVHLAEKAVGASKSLVAMLSGTNDALTNNALDVLLVLAKDEANLKKLADAGAIKPLVALLRRDTDDAQKEKAARLLGNLAFEQAYEVPIAKAGAIPPLVQLLSSTDDALKGSAALALFHLAFNETNQAEIGRAGAIQPLVQLLVDATQALEGFDVDAYDGDEWHAAAELMGHTAGVLFHLAANEANKDKIWQAGGPGALVKVVEMFWLAEQGERERATLEHAAGGLFHFSAFYLWPDAIKPLVEVVKLRASADYDSDNDTLVEYAAGALFRLKSDIPVAMAKSLVIPPLVALLSGTAEQQENAAGALAYFSGFRTNQPAIQRAGAIPPLVALLDSPIADDAARTLSNLAGRNDNDRNKRTIVQACQRSEGGRAFLARTGLGESPPSEESDSPGPAALAPSAVPAAAPAGAERAAARPATHAGHASRGGMPNMHMYNMWMPGMHGMWMHGGMPGGMPGMMGGMPGMMGGMPGMMGWHAR